MIHGYLIPLAFSLSLGACNAADSHGPAGRVEQKGKNTLRDDLEKLRQQLPEPFHEASDLNGFLELDDAVRLTNNGKRSAKDLLHFVETGKDPALVRVAVILLSRLDPRFFYVDLMAIIEKADRATVEAMETGFWHIKRDQNGMARDLSALADAGHPNPLLLLQRPVARAARQRLLSFVRQDIDPLSVYAMYCLEYTLDPGDREMLDALASKTKLDAVRRLAVEFIDEIPSAPPKQEVR